MSNSIYNKDKTLPNFAQEGYEEWRKKQEAKSKAANIDPLDGIDPGGAKAGYDGVYDKLSNIVTVQKPTAPTTSYSPSTGYVPNYYVPEEDRELYDKTRLGLTTGAKPKTEPASAPESAPATTPVTAPKVDTPSPEDFGLSVDEFTGFTYDDFQVSDAYKQAMEYTNSLLSQLTSGRTSYTDQINALMGEYQNRDKFSYDASTDAMFQQMLASSMNSGKMAMQDTIGQAAALTGGYGNTYGTAAGNAAYNQYISDAYSNLPEYYNLALDAYNMEGDQMLSELAMLRDADSAEYSRLVDSYRASLDAANTMYDREYTQYIDDRNAAESEYWDDLNFRYGAYMDALNQANKDREFNYNAAWDDKIFNYDAERDRLDREERADEREYQREQDKKKWEYETGNDLISALTGNSVAIPTLTSAEINAIKEIGAIYGDGEKGQQKANAYLEGIGKNPEATPDAEAFFNAIDSFLAEGVDGKLHDIIYSTDTSQSAQDKYWYEILKKR